MDHWKVRESDSGANKNSPRSSRELAFHKKLLQGETSQAEKGERVSETEMLQKLGDQWEIKKHYTNAGREVPVFIHKNPGMLYEGDAAGKSEEHFSLAATLGVSARSFTPVEEDRNSSTYECFGDTLAQSRGKMRRVDAEMVLQDNFKPIAATEVTEGDVIAYRYDSRHAPKNFDEFAIESKYEHNQLLHLGRISMADHSEVPSEIWAKSKMGGEKGKYEHEPHHLNNVYGNNYTYYRPLVGDGSLKEE